MIVPPTDGLRVARYAEGAGYSPDQWARALAGVDWSKAELLSDKPGSSVWRATLVVQKRPMAVVIKCEPIEGLKRRLQVLLGRSHAHRHWRGAELLKGHGFRTADPKAIVYGRRDGRTIECLLMEALDGKTVLEHLAAGDLGVRGEHAAARAVGDLTRRLWQAGIYNRDHKGSNLMVVGGDPACIAVLDAVGLREADILERALDGDRESVLEKMSAKILIEASGCGVPPRRALQARFLKSAHPGGHDETRRFADSVMGWVEAHGDPTPTHDPLARPGR